MNKNQSWYQREITHDPVFLHKLPVTFVEGKGSKLTDADGNEYIDCTSSFGIMGVGYANSTVTQAITQQLNKLSACHSFFANDARTEFLEALMQITPDAMDKAYLCNSGTESVEAALKVAMANTKRHKIVACTGAYHGLTLGATGLSSNSAQRAPFAHALNEAQFVPYNDTAALEAAIDEDTALFIVEPVQANDGGTVASLEFLKAARQLTTRTGTVLAFDEICTGFCRTGTWFACDQYGIAPDLITIAKSFGGGLPFGALLMNADLAKRFPKRLHSNTYGGNPLVMAAGLGAIKFAHEEQLSRKSQTRGERLIQGLSQIPEITRVKGKGLLVGIEIDSKIHATIPNIMEQLMKKHHVLVIPRATGILFMPPLIISDKEIDYVINAVKQTLGTPD